MQCWFKWCKCKVTISICCLWSDALRSQYGLFYMFLKFKQKSKYSRCGRTCFILVFGFVQLNINIHSHKWGILIIVRHMLCFLWITVLMTNVGAPGICLWRQMLTMKHFIQMWDKLSVSHTHFTPIPYVVVFLPCETQKNFKEPSYRSSPVLSITVDIVPMACG